MERHGWRQGTERHSGLWGIYSGDEMTGVLTIYECSLGRG